MDWTAGDSGRGPAGGGGTAALGRRGCHDRNVWQERGGVGWGIGVCVYVCVCVGVCAWVCVCVGVCVPYTSDCVFICDKVTA